MRSWQEPTDEEVEKVIPQLIGDKYHYFFDRLENPLWIEPLRKRGLFKEPLGNTNNKDGSFSCPIWRASKYLLRMAKYEIVQKDISQILEECGIPDNYSVHQDFLQIALLMPLDFQIKWALIEKKWLKNQEHIWIASLAKSIAELGISLLINGKDKEAGDLFLTLFRLLQEKKSKEERDIGYLKMPPHPTSVFDSWMYDELIKKVAEEIASLNKLDMLGLFQKLLNASIYLSRDSWENQNPFNDLSFLWRPAIEDHPQNRNIYEIMDALVTALRDCALKIIGNDPSKFKTVIQMLEEYKPKRAIFFRLSLYLLGVFSKNEDVLLFIEERLLNKDLFDCYETRHEYMHLLKKEFKNLTPESKRKILWMIWRKNNKRKVRELLSKSPNHLPSDEEIESYIRSERVNWLSFIRDDLPIRWRNEYIELSEQQPPSRHPDFPFYMDEMVRGDQSPFSENELSSLSVEELVMKLTNWVPPENRYMEPSKEGLGRVLGGLIRKTPEKFCKQASLFKIDDPIFVWFFIDAFRDVYKRGVTFDWNPILDLCGWAVKQNSQTESYEQGESDQVFSWRSTHQSIAWLLGDALHNGKAPIPFELREQVWEILYLLTRNSSPTEEEEERFGDSRKRAYDFALNCVRGSAMIAAVKYIEWVRASFKLDNEELLKSGFDAIPEVKDVLEERLDLLVEPSRAVHSVYGLYFPWLVAWDRQWTIDHIDKIFPKETKYFEIRQAAWNTYLKWCFPYDEPLEILYDEYLMSVRNIENDLTKSEEYDSPIVKIGEHLTTYYARGLLTLSPDSLLTIFLEKASDEIRAMTMEYIARQLENSPPGISSKETIDRLKEYWEIRLKSAKKSQKQDNFSKEIAAYGYWATCKQFDNKWVLNNLCEALRFSKRIDNTEKVQPYLAEISNDFPEEAITCLELIFEGCWNDWEISWLASQENFNRKIIESATKSGNISHEKAQKLIQTLGGMGFYYYRDLLDS